MTRVYFALGWLMFKGWKNSFWREDTISKWLCDHKNAIYDDQYGYRWCVSCGARIK